MAEIRQNYSNLLEEVETNKAELILLESDRLTGLVDEANQVFLRGSAAQLTTSPFTKINFFSA